jgi:hypothetical protein
MSDGFIDLDAAFYNRMAGDHTLTGLLASYPDAEATSGEMPAIFTDREVPEDATLPYIESFGQLSDVPDDDKITVGREVHRDIFCFTERGQTDTLNQIADRVKTLFHRHALEITGATTISASVSGPIPAETDDTLIGVVLTVRLRFEMN